MDRIEEIIRLEKVADQRDKISSADRWRAAELIHAEIADGKTQSALAREIGQSQSHVRYMMRCWDTVIIKGRLEFDDYEHLPIFAKIYNSPDVRGADEPAEAQATDKPQRNQHSRIPPTTARLTA
jgi:hypothetical protein